MALDTLPTPSYPAPHPGFWGRVHVVVRVAVALLACLVIVGSAAMIGKLIIDPNGSEEFTVGRRPALFYQVFENEERAFPDNAYADVVGVAHNSGGRIEATLQAIIFGADVIEVDVVDIDGELYSAHSPPIPFIGDRFFRGPSLEQIWTASYRADALKLDLKETSPGYVELVADFLVSRPRDRDTIVVSRSPWVLATLRERAPDSILLLSVPNEDAFNALQVDETLQRTIDGVSARESVIDTSMVIWLAERDLRTFAWTVNDLDRVNELIRLGVEGITTENLAILTLLGGDQETEPGLALSPRVATSEESDHPTAEHGAEQRPCEAYLDADVDQADFDQDEVVEREEHEQHGQACRDHQAQESPVREQSALRLPDHGLTASSGIFWASSQRRASAAERRRTRRGSSPKRDGQSRRCRTWVRTDQTKSDCRLAKWSRQASWLPFQSSTLWRSRYIVRRQSRGKVTHSGKSSQTIVPAAPITVSPSLLS